MTIARQSRSDDAVDGAEMLTVEAVSKIYRSRTGPVHAVDNVSFSVGAGEFLSIVGQSGCGKSTLLKMAAGVVEPSSGVIRIGANEQVRGSAEIGMVFQTPVLLQWRDVLSNVMLPIEILRRDRQAGEEYARHLLRLVGLEDFQSHRPGELSGGMQQRVAICRALVFDPPILLMDEPFGALDALTRDEMGVELLRIWRETSKAIVFVTHSIEESVLLSDRVLVMSKRPGQIAAEVPIDLPRPRDLDVRYEARFGDLAREIREAIG